MRRLSDFVLLCLIFNVSCLIHKDSAASLGDVCKADDECSSIANAMCSKMYECSTGVCACATGYGSSNGVTCLKLVGYSGVCGAGYMCAGEHQGCATGRCKCDGEWYEYSSLAGVCTLRTYRLLTQTCGGWYKVECLVTDTNGIECSGTTCRCIDGYTMDLSKTYQTCRPPRFGEHCLHSPHCEVSFDTKSISKDTSNIESSCQENTCKCPASHDHRQVNGWNLCLSRLNEGVALFQKGDNCTSFNECESLFCVQCPGADMGVCMSQLTNDGALQTISRYLLVALFFLTDTFKRIFYFIQRNFDTISTVVLLVALFYVTMLAVGIIKWAIRGTVKFQNTGFALKYNGNYYNPEEVELMVRDYSKKELLMMYFLKLMELFGEGPPPFIHPFL